MYNLKKAFLELELNGLQLTDYCTELDYSEEQILYEGTPFFLILFLLNQVQPPSGAIVYDLGSGYGRFVLTGALHYNDVIFRGIELIGQRVNSSNDFAGRLGLNNALFIEGNVLESDFSDGQIFYLFNPFSDETLVKMIRKLKLVAERKKIIIAVIGKLNNLFLAETWLNCRFNQNFTYRGLDLYWTCIYYSESIEKHS